MKKLSQIINIKKSMSRFQEWPFESENTNLIIFFIQKFTISFIEKEF